MRSPIAPRSPFAAPFALAALAALASVAACATRPSNPVPAPVAQPIALSPADRCAASLATVDPAMGTLEAGGAGDTSRATRAAAGCADLFATAWPRCADTWRGLAEVDPAARVATVLDACRNIYCLDLPAPQPALCEGELPPPGAQQRVAAAELFAAMTALEGTAAVFGGLAIPDPTPLVAPPPVEPARVSVALHRGARGLRVVYGDNAADLAPGTDMTAGLDALLGPAEGRSLSIAADRDLVLADVIGVLDAAKALGFTRIAMQTVVE